MEADTLERRAARGDERAFTALMTASKAALHRFVRRYVGDDDEAFDLVQEAYASAWLSTTQGMSPWLGLPFALLLTGLSALAIGMLTLRLGGHFLPLSTIAWGLSIAMIFGNIDALGRHTGISNIPALEVGPW